MNKDLLDQLSAEERSVAEKLSSAAETMKLSQSFQWNLETKLMDAYPSQNKKQNSVMKFLKPAGWALAAIAAMLLVSWMLRTLLPGIQPAAIPTETQQVSFEENVRQGNICAAALAMTHNFSLLLTSPDKTQLAVVDADSAIGEIRSFTWSLDGTQLNILGNTTGSGNIYHADAVRGRVQPVLAPGELGYMMDAAWSRDGKKVVLWSTQNNRVIYVMNADGTGLEEHKLGKTQILGAPQFWPDGSSVVFYGADSNYTGLFEFIFNDSQVSVVSVNGSVESATSFAFSPDGTKLAYVAYDHENGEAQLFVQDLTTYEIEVHGAFPIPKGSGSSVPSTANMSWSVDGKWLTFDVGRGANDRVIYLAPMDRLDLLRTVANGRAAAISGDGRCLAYMNDQQVFLLDLSQIEIAKPLAIGQLPIGKGVANYQLDRLQWRP